MWFSNNYSATHPCVYTWINFGFLGWRFTWIIINKMIYRSVDKSLRKERIVKGSSLVWTKKNKVDIHQVKKWGACYKQGHNIYLHEVLKNKMWCGHHLLGHYTETWGSPPKALANLSSPSIYVSSFETTFCNRVELISLIGHNKMRCGHHLLGYYTKTRESPPKAPPNLSSLPIYVSSL